MEIIINPICGMMFGFEFVTDEEEKVSYLVVDLFIVRIMFCKG